MPAVTIRNLPEEAHRALKRRAAANGRSTEAEIRGILDAAVKPKERVKVGSELAAFGRRHGGLDLDVQREATPAEAASFEEFVLDTNVVSEPMKRGGNPVVKDWLDQQAADTLYLTTTSLAELLLGIETLPRGKRRAGLDAALTDLLEALFGTRVLPFDQRAASVYPPLVSRARKAGQAVSVSVGQIAAIAAVHGFTVATRDTRPFAAAAVPVINPWQTA